MFWCFELMFWTFLNSSRRFFVFFFYLKGVTGRYSVKRFFERQFKIHGKTSVSEPLFNKVAGFRLLTCNFIKKETSTLVFSCEFWVISYDSYSVKPLETFAFVNSAVTVSGSWFLLSPLNYDFLFIIAFITEFFVFSLSCFHICFCKFLKVFIWLSPNFLISLLFWL